MKADAGGEQEKDPHNRLYNKFVEKKEKEREESENRARRGRTRS